MVVDVEVGVDFGALREVPLCRVVVDAVEGNAIGPKPVFGIEQGLPAAHGQEDEPVPSRCDFQQDGGCPDVFPDAGVGVRHAGAVKVDGDGHGR